MQPEIICLGEALIDISPLSKGGNIVESGEMRMAAGGGPANVAVGLARLGTPTGFIGRVGDDFFGHHLKTVLAQNEVDTAGMRFDREANTGLAFVTWDANGDATYLFYRKPSADTRLTPTDLDPAYIGQAQALQVSGSLILASEPSASATYAAFEIARQAGILVCYDVNLRLTAWPDEATARAGVSRPLDYASILKMNRPELEFLTGESDPIRGTQKLWQPYRRLILVTLDKEGCFYRTERATGTVGSKLVEAVDTVGAGDGFLAGLLDGLRRGSWNFDDEELIRRACRQAAAVGALVVTRPGAIPAMPTREEVDRFGF